MRKNIQLVMVAAMFILLAGSARAISVEDANNSNTGEGSTNSSEVVIENDYKEVNNNEGAVVNTVMLNLSSGDNVASENTGDPEIIPETSGGGKGGGFIQTGAASFDVKIENTLNTNTSKIAFNEPEEGNGKGGGSDQPVVTELPKAELSAAGTPVTLPSSGPDFLNQMIALIGLPLLGTMMMASYEINSKQKLTVK